MNVERRGLTLLGIGAMALGFGLTAFGLHFIFLGNGDVDEESIRQSVRLGNLTSVNLIEPEFATDDDPATLLKVNFDTLTIFQGDVVGIKVTADGIKPDVQGIAVLIEDDTFDLNMTHLGKEIERGRKYNTTFELIPDLNHQASVKKNVPFLTPHQKVTIYGIALYDNNSSKRFFSDQIVTTVLSDVDKLQQETNNILRISDARQEKTNLIFIGLSLIGIAIAPIIAGVDIFLRIHFDRNDNELHRQWYL